MRNFIIAVAGLFLLLPAFAAAENPCTVDTDKFCPELQGAAKMQCIMDHEKELSPGCKEKLGNFRSGKTTAPNKPRPCAADMEKFCKKVKGGRKAEKACLLKHQAEVSAACARTLAENDGDAAARNPCEDDLMNFCPEVKGGAAKKTKCLEEHSEHISKPCKNKLDSDSKKVKRSKPVKTMEQQ